MNKKELAAYSTDASRIIGKVENVVFPKNVREVCEIVRLSNLDIVPRGAGSGFEGGAVPSNSLVIDMTKMNQITGFNSVKRFVVVESGTILKELNEKLNARGFEFPIDPLNKGISSIGGMIATNSLGKRSMKYGSIRDWIDEVEFVNGKGETIKTSKADLMDVCGMEGTTGIITSAKIRIIPVIKRSISVFQTDKLDEVLDVGRRLKSEKDVVSVILFSKDSSRMLGFPERYNLIVEFDSERGKIRGEEYKKLMNTIENAYYTFGVNDYYNSEDPKFFFDKLKEFLEILEEMRTPYFGYLGNGIITAFFKDSEKSKRDEVINIVRRSLAKFGKYGYGSRRKDFVESFDSRIISRVKQRYDPYGKLNRGKLTGESVNYAKRNNTLEEKSKPIVKSIVKPDIKETRVNLGEQITANKVTSEVLECKSPEEKLAEFIKEEETRDVCEKEPVFDTQDIKPLDDKPIVEEFSRKISQEIVKTSDVALKPRLAVDYNQIRSIMTNKNANVNTNPADRVPKRVETTKEEQDLINKILGNKIKKEDSNSGGKY